VSRIVYDFRDQSPWNFCPVCASNALLASITTYGGGVENTNRTEIIISNRNNNKTDSRVPSKTSKTACTENRLFVWNTQLSSSFHRFHSAPVRRPSYPTPPGARYCVQPHALCTEITRSPRGNARDGHTRAHYDCYYRYFERPPGRCCAAAASAGGNVHWTQHTVFVSGGGCVDAIVTSSCQVPFNWLNWSDAIPCPAAEKVRPEVRQHAHVANANLSVSAGDICFSSGHFRSGNCLTDELRCPAVGFEPFWSLATIFFGLVTDFINVPFNKYYFSLSSRYNCYYYDFRLHS
jgi:hypothetical protein